MDEQKTENITQEENTEDTEKQSTKNWTQSEVDQHVAKILKRELEKFGDYETIKTEYEKIAQEKKEKEDAQKTEAEKLMAKLEEVTQRNTELESLTDKFQKEQLKNTVLGNPKYSQLTKAYKNMVTLSSNEEEVIASADEALEEFKRDFAGKTSETFGIPTPKKDSKIIPKEAIDSADKMRDSLRGRLSSILNR